MYLNERISSLRIARNKWWWRGPTDILAQGELYFPLSTSNKQDALVECIERVDITRERLWKPTTKNYKGYLKNNNKVLLKVDIHVGL